MLLEDGYGLAVSRYIHMNPVCVSELGPEKRRKAAEGRGLAARPVPEVLKKRVRSLRNFRWSSYRAYAGYEKPPEWLDRGAVLAMVKGGEAGNRELVEGQILRMVEGMKREKRAAFWGRYGDWGRGLVLWGARVYGGLTLAELGREAGGLDYSAVSMATVRVVHLAKKDRALRQAMTALMTKCEQG